MAQRDRNSGFVYHNGAGRWVAIITHPTTGKRLQKYATSKEEALRKLQAHRRRILWRRLLRKHES